MGASVAIEVGTARNVLTIPISALHTTGTRHTVDLYRDGGVTTQPVVIGVVGAERVQIKSGLAAGDRVVLADVSAPLPSDNNAPFGRSDSSLGGALTGGTGKIPFVVNGGGPPPNLGGN